MCYCREASGGARPYMRAARIPLDEATATALEGRAANPMAGAWTFCFLVSACTSVLALNDIFEREQIVFIKGRYTFYVRGGVDLTIGEFSINKDFRKKMAKEIADLVSAL